MPVAAFLAFLLLLVQAPPPPGSALEAFFVGTTEGSGTVRVVLAGRHGVRDRTVGRRDAAGALILDQIVYEEGRPERRRRWRLERAGGNRVAGTISDARGPVSGTLAGDTLYLSYRLAEGPSVEQWIALRPGGRTASNRMVFRRFGVRVATVETLVRRID